MLLRWAMGHGSQLFIVLVNPMSQRLETKTQNLPPFRRAIFFVSLSSRTIVPLAEPGIDLSSISLYRFSRAEGSCFVLQNAILLSLKEGDKITEPDDWWPPRTVVWSQQRRHKGRENWKMAETENKGTLGGQGTLSHLTSMGNGGWWPSILFNHEIFSYHGFFF